MSAALCRRNGIWLASLLLVSASAWSHTIAGSNAVFVQSIDGPAVAAFLYLGAKHMVTGYDHLFFCAASCSTWLDPCRYCTTCRSSPLATVSPC